jgi:hypothetical protein
MFRKNNYFWIFIIFVIVFSFLIRIWGFDFNSLSNEQRVFIILSALISALSVLGFYLLVKELFDKNIAIIAAFLLATSSWHIFVSKTNIASVFASFVFVYAFYFIWHGLKYGHIFDFFIAGLFGGTGLYINKGYLIMPIVVLIMFWNYWDYIKKDFSLSKYEQVKINILKGFSLLLLTVIVVTFPMGLYFWQNPGLLFSIDNSILSSTNPFAEFYSNLIWLVDKIIMVKFDTNNLNLVSWPVSIFFIIGFIKEFTHWLKRKHGHFSVIHTFVFSWLFITPIPFLFLIQEPSFWNINVILMPIIILSTKGLWWTIEKLNQWSHITLPPNPNYHTKFNVETLLALISLLISITILEISEIYKFTNFIYKN